MGVDVVLDVVAVVIVELFRRYEVAHVRVEPEGRPLLRCVLEEGRAAVDPVEVLLKNEDVGFVVVGQPVKVKVTAYPFQKYGLLDGKVSLVSADSADPKQQQQQGQPPSLTYRAIVRLDAT